MTNQEMLEQAGAQVRMLAEGAGIRPVAMAVDLTDAGRQLLPSMLSHQLVADHAVKMRLVARLDRLLERMTAEQPEAEQVRDSRELGQLCAAAARFTERYRQGLMSLARLQRWPGMAPASRGKPSKTADDDPDDDDPDGGKSLAEVLAEMQTVTGAAEAMLQTVPTHEPAAPSPVAPANRGRLRHGNPSGDFLAAPRCGAKCRSGGACRQPAMGNGRCRLHGGKSTGARTAEGLARCRSTSLVHGQRSAEVIQLKSDLARSGRRLAALTRLAKSSVAAGLRPAPTKSQSERPTPCPATEGMVAPQSHKDHKDHATSILPPPKKPSSSCPSWLRGESSFGQHTRSERPTPCPATSGMTHAEPRRHGGSGGAEIIDFFSALSAPPRANLRSERPTPCPATPARRRAATG